MKRIFPILVLLALLSSDAVLHAQANVVSWAKRYVGAGTQGAADIFQAGDGTFFAAGWTRAPGAGFYDTDFWVLHLDSLGHILWQRAYGSPQYMEDPWRMQPTSDGGFAVIGLGTWYGVGGHAPLLVKYDVSGTIQWQKTYIARGREWGNGFQQTADGGYIVASPTDFGNNNIKPAILKLKSNGDIQWQKAWSLPVSAGGFEAIQLTPDGGYIAVGYAGFSTSSDLLVVKLDPGATVQWATTYGGNGQDEAASVQCTADGGYIVAGITGSFGADGYDAWVLKLTSSGVVQWEKSYGLPDKDFIFDIRPTPDGGYIASSITHFLNVPHEDGWLLRLDSQGNVVAQRAFSTGDGDSGFYGTVHQCADGGFIVAGSVALAANNFFVVKTQPDLTLGGSCPATISAATAVTPHDTHATVQDITLTELPQQPPIFVAYDTFMTSTDTSAQEVTVWIGPSAPPLAITTTTLSQGTNGMAYSVQLQATGGVLPYIWALAPNSDQLQPGLTLNPNGALTGIPTSRGTSNLVVQVTDAAGTTVDQRLPLTIITMRPVIVIPGIMGTTLYDYAGNPLWIDPSYLTVLWPSQMQLSDTGDSLSVIRAGPIFDGTTSASYLNVYGALLTFLQDAGYPQNTLLFTFPYDWRLENQRHVAALNDLIEKAVKMSGQSKVDIIAHSMGGLLVRSYVQVYGESRLSKVIYLGTPQRGAPKAFCALALPDSIMDMFFPDLAAKLHAAATKCPQLSEILKTIMGTPFVEMARTFPSVYELLPVDNFIHPAGDLKFIPNTQCYMQVAQGGFLVSDRWVATAESFYQHIGALITVPQFAIAGSGIPTLTELSVVNNPTERLWVGVSGDGDGTVPINSANYSVGTDIRTFYIANVEHLKLPLAAVTTGLLLPIIQDYLTTVPAGVRTQPVGLGLHVVWYSGSPIEVTIADGAGNIDGVMPDWSLREDIPFSSFFEFESNEGGFLPANTYQSTVKATSPGVFSLTFNTMDAAGNVLQTTAFTNVPVAASSIGTFTLSPNNANPILALDIDGNGTVDFSIVANQPIPVGIYADMAAVVVTSFALGGGIQNSLLSKLAAAKNAATRGQSAVAKNILGALLNEIAAQSGKALTETQASGLTAIVNRIIGRL